MAATRRRRRRRRGGVTDDLIADSAVVLLPALRVLDCALSHPTERQLNPGHQRELPIDTKLHIAVCKPSRSEARSLQREVDFRSVEVHGAYPKRLDGRTLILNLQIVNLYPVRF